MKFQIRHCLFVMALLAIQPQSVVLAQGDDEFEFFESDEAAATSDDFSVEEPAPAAATGTPPPPEEALEEELDFADSFEEEDPAVVDLEAEEIPEEVLPTEEEQSSQQAQDEVPLPEVAPDELEFLEEIEVAPMETVPEPSIEVAPVIEPEIQPEVPVVLPTEPAVVATKEDFSESPDYDRERRFHDIFMKYNQNPTSQEAWGQATGQTAQEYVVLKGDTLWSISKTLFNDTEYWPKIWSLNVNIITNPHEIRPGMKVSFIEGSFEEPPLLNLLAEGAGAGEDVVELANPEDAKEKLTRHKYKTAQPIPDSLPEYRNGYYARTSELIFEVKKFEYPRFPEVIASYIESTPLIGVGRVVETELGLNSAGENQYIFVRIKPGETSRSFLVMQTPEKIPLGTGARAPKAFVHEILGTIELMELTNVAENIYRARIDKAFAPIVKNALLRAGTELPMMIPEPGTPGQVPFLKVIGGAGDSPNMFGDSSFVYLSKGSAHGVQVGQEYNIYANNLIRNPGSLAKSGDRVIGRLKVVKISEKVSTAFVLAVEEPLMTNDYASNQQDSSASQ